MVMKRMRFVISALALMFFFVVSNAFAVHEGFAVRYRKALYDQNVQEMVYLIERNAEAVPGEVRQLVDEALAPGVSKEDMKDNIYVAESMAAEYKKITGDIAPLKDAKTRIFESKLAPVTESAVVDGVHIVNAATTADVVNVFIPGNIVIKKGETVRWVNSDNVPHLLASMPVIGVQGIFSPRITPGEAWEYKFDKPGDYYYICFIHKVMYGKVTVVE